MTSRLHGLFLSWCESWLTWRRLAIIGRPRRRWAPAALECRMSTTHQAKPPPCRILFVCLGNICRSPTAEGVLRSLVRQAGLEGRIELDSAGTGAWHLGSPPDERATQTALTRGIVLE